MATRDEVKSELMSRIDNVFPEDRELDQEGDVPILAQAISSTDEDVDQLIADIEEAETGEENPEAEG
jgi:hypothetical protein